MADRIITVTDPSVVTNDTLSGYNNYSDIDGQLGTTMTPTEATNGKTVTLSDGAVHEVTSKPVGTTNGEFSAVVSNAVTVDLSAQTQYKVVLNQEEAQFADDGNLSDNSPLTTCKFEFKTSSFPNEASALLCGIGRNLPDSAAYNDVRVAHYNTNDVYVGMAGGFARYLKSDLINKDVVATFDKTSNDPAVGVVVTADGTVVSQVAVAGTFATSPLGNGVQIGLVATAGGTTSVASVPSLEYLKVTFNGVLTHDLALNEGSGLTIGNSVGGGIDLTIDVGTGSISTVWVEV